jgi:hypothetical protein
MESLFAPLQRIYDEINPFSTGNLVLYYVWLVTYSATLIAAWRAPGVKTRFVCFVVNQALQIGVFMSWSLTVLLAVTHWLPTLLTFLAVVAVTLYLLRGR